MRKIFVLFLLLIDLYSDERCIKCHKNYNDLDAFHKIKDFGCVSCHKGNPSENDKLLAHKNIVKNPALLQHANISCSTCHKTEIYNVSNSIMNNLNGIVDVLRFQFKESKTIIKTKGIEYIKNKKDLTLSEDHFSKLCAPCHIDQKQDIFKEKGFNIRGGGCVDCHIKKGKNKHPIFTTKISTKTCLKCHNRSNRIGLSYIGKFESEGYLEYKYGKISNRLDKNRNFYHLPSDLHYKAGLDCIDCHTIIGVMGDGKKYKHMEESVDISCNDCHRAKFVDSIDYPLAIKLAILNGNFKLPKKIATTKKKKTPLYNVGLIDNEVVLFRKKDGKKIKIKQLSNNNYHNNLHQRLDCSSCHSSWIPSCYGCHEIYFKDKKQYDWIKGKKTLGKWMEKRSYLRYEDNTLAIGYNKKIYPSAPGCQIFMNIYEKGELKKQWHSLAYGAWNPHTTSKSKKCNECHFSSSAIGLGRGIFNIKDNNISFIPYYQDLNIGFNIDMLVDKQGNQKQTFSRSFARGFNKKEIKKIIDVYKCSICHDSWDDKIYKDFYKSKKQFFSKDTSCSKQLLP